MADVRRMVLIGLAVLASAAGGAAPEWRRAEPGYAWEFPRDLAVHPDYATEWWYVTGNLQDAAGAELGFQSTFFRIGLASGGPLPDSEWASRDLVMAHASVTDAATGRHAFSEVLRRATPLLGGFGVAGDSVLAWCRAPEGTPGAWRLVHADGAFRLEADDRRQGLRYDLTCRPTQAPVLHGDEGFSAKNAAGTAASLYFSHTRLEVTGHVARGDTLVAVSGEAWLDREIFTSTLAPDQVGWDWLSLQLADGRELMLYRLRDRRGATDHAAGTLVGRDGRASTLEPDDWSWEPTDTWTSPRTGAEYPVRWRLRVPAAGIDLDLEPLLEAQENVSRRSGVRYWEGAVRARPRDPSAGAVVGRGYVELTGYGEGSRPPL